MEDRDGNLTRSLLCSLPSAPYHTFVVPVHLGQHHHLHCYWTLVHQAHLTMPCRLQMVSISFIHFYNIIPVDMNFIIGTRIHLQPLTVNSSVKHHPDKFTAYPATSNPIA